jgi:hypothetical protein
MERSLKTHTFGAFFGQLGKGDVVDLAALVQVVPSHTQLIHFRFLCVREERAKSRVSQDPMQKKKRR